MSQVQSLRTLLSQDQFLMAAGADDVISARLVEEAGFPLVYYSGGVSAGALGYPDFGMRTLPFNEVFNGLLGWDQALAFIDHYTQTECNP